MNKAETRRFNQLYQRHLRLLKLQGKAEKTIDAYSRAVRRISEYFDCCPDTRPHPPHLGHGSNSSKIK